MLDPALSLLLLLTLQEASTPPSHSPIPEVCLPPMGLLCQKPVLPALFKGDWFVCAHLSAKLKGWGGQASHQFSEFTFFKKNHFCLSQPLNSKCKA